MQRGYNPGSSRRETHFSNFYKLEQYRNVSRQQILKNCFSRIQKISLHYATALIT